jgi:hypothetical protein
VLPIIKAKRGLFKVLRWGWPYAKARRLAHNWEMDMDQSQLAEAVRQACIAAALAAYEEAGVLGLCAEGRWEAAVSAMQSLDLRGVAAGDSGDSAGLR